jgi:hypothetical protein
MSRTADDVETYLIELDRAVESSARSGDEATFVLRAPTGDAVVVRVDAPIVAVQATIGRAPDDAVHRLRIFERLLVLNATDLLHASYGLEDEQIVLSAALALENLDRNELEAALSDIDVALMRHTSELAHAARD